MLNALSRRGDYPAAACTLVGQSCWIVKRVAASLVGLSLVGMELFVMTAPVQAQVATAQPTGVLLKDAPTAMLHEPIADTLLSAKSGAGHPEANAARTSDLLPLTARRIESPSESIALDQVSESLNVQIENSRDTDTNQGFQLGSLPIIGDLLDEAGNLDMGIDLPFDMTIGDVMGETGLVFSTDFTVD